MSLKSFKLYHINLSLQCFIALHISFFLYNISTMILGAHFSISGGISNALKEAESLDCNAVQMFIRNPRSFSGKVLEDEQVDEFKKLRKEYKIKTVVVHAVYLQNLASAKDNFAVRSAESNIADMIEAARIGVDYYVLHLGSYKDTTHEKGIEKVISGLRLMSEQAPDGIMILLENVSGSGKLIGGDLKELAYIMEQLGWPENVGVCIDTCHAWCYGYDIKTEEGIKSFVKEIESTIGIKRVKIVHLNDTKEKFRSKHDRHANIGEGELGVEGISNFINHPKFRKLPFLLETPKKEEDADVKNVAMVKKLYKL